MYVYVYRYMYMYMYRYMYMYMYVHRQAHQDEPDLSAAREMENIIFEMVHWPKQQNGKRET